MFWVQGLLCHRTAYGTFSKREEDGSRTEFLIILPSYVIQEMGNSISIELPSNWHNSKWIGFALRVSHPLIFELLEFVIRAHMIALGDMPQNH